MRLRSLLRDERGASPVEFVLVGAMLTALTLGVLQLALALYVRNVLHDAAASGARVAALADARVEDGVGRAQDLITRAIGPSYAQDVTVAVYGTDPEWVQVTVVSAVPVAGLIGIPDGWEVSARAPRERFG